MTRRATLLLVAVSLLLPVAPAGANLGRDAAARAEALVEAGQHAAAVELLAETLAACGRADDAADDAADDCRVRTTYGLGYVRLAWAEADPPNAVSHREAAVAALRRAHRLRPEHRGIAVSFAQALAATGAHAEAERVFATVADAKDPGDLVRRSELAFLAGDPEEARTFLFRAERLRPRDVDVHRRLLRTYHGAPGAIDEHRAWCERLWAAGLDSLAVSGLELLVERFATDPAAAEWALVAWAELPATAGELDAADLDRLPATWTGPLRTELRLLVDGPLEELPAELSHWVRTPERRSAAVAVLRARARRDEASGDLETAERALAAAYRLAPGPGEIAHGILGRGDAWADATVELAAFLQRHRRREELDRLLAELFDGKMAGYAGGDLETIGRFHTVLGVVLSEEGRLSSPGYDNAEFQLRRAIEVEGQLAQREDRRPRPLPHLERRYGDVLAALDRPDAAATAYQRAALGYLGLDDLRSAELSAGLARAAGASDETLRAIETVVADRERLDAGKLEPTAVLDGKEASWVLGKAELTLPGEILDRQRFRFLADLAASRRVVDPSHAAVLGLEARSAALELEGAATTSDAERLQTLDATYDLDLRTAGTSMERFDLDRLDSLLAPGVRYDG